MNPPAAGPGGRLVERIDALLPQTQCQRCGYPSCRAYAAAVANGEAAINRCPPGGRHTIEALSRATGRARLPLDPGCGREGVWRRAVVDESRCIGCTLCIQVCPVDAIVGAAKRMHTVVASECTACELCVPVCPVDCVLLEPMRPIDLPGAGASTRSFLDRWMNARAAQARQRYARRSARLAREAPSRVVRTQSMAPRADAARPRPPAAERGEAPLLPEDAQADLAAALGRASARRTWRGGAKVGE